MADAKNEIEHKAAEQVNEHSEESMIDGLPDKGADDEQTTTTAANKSKLGLFLIIVLFLISASLGGLKLTGQLQPLYASLQAQLILSWQELSETFSGSTEPAADVPQTEQSQAEAAKVEQAKIDQMHHQAVQTSDSTQPDQSNTTQPTTVTVTNDVQLRSPSQTMASPASDPAAVTSAEIKALLRVIDQLRTEMQQLKVSQQSLHDGLLEQQQMNTQVRLRWIADPASRLPQMQLAWEEISLLPGLSEPQRQLAVQMHRLARIDAQHLRQWKASLQKWAEALAAPIHVDVLPQPEQPWLAWVVGQFQLRHAPSTEARRLADLRGRLLDAARQLSLESWPAEGAWQSLHAELLLQIKAMQGDGRAASVETGLPLDFSAIQHDIRRLRQTARQWSGDDHSKGEGGQQEAQQGGIL